MLFPIEEGNPWFQTVGSDGFGVVGGEGGQVLHEGFSALGGFSQAGSCMTDILQGYSASVRHPCSSSLDVVFFPDRGCVYGHNIVQQGGDN